MTLTLCIYKHRIIHLTYSPYVYARNYAYFIHVNYNYAIKYL